ncbi:Peptide deformylase [Shewanella denitrificans OS217]|uniref:Peptide deformylase n=1 Tax=Shewanella denitrificans (strain OS217 / ATCC BAA-1090 / DSM 15013) TaxID=318161 RepID=Q12K36_SHEDO|nr:peptide deformylase [Shewanella denitrificans]ABE56190.1 Peptide deformylase [Shewanella denitrificans OS217]
MSSSQILPIAITGEPILNRIAVKVSQFDASLIQLADDMLATMMAANGVGIAAGQVHSPLAMFVMASRPNERYPNAPVTEPRVIINPQILSYSTQTQAGIEGCLSIPDSRMSIVRSQQIDTRFQNLKGEFIEQSFSDFEARIFQHEFDHIKGITLIERLAQQQKQAYPA